MRTFFRFSAGAALLALIWQSPLSAQGCPAIMIPGAGGWSEYKSDNGTMRLAVLGNETRAGKSLVRMELSVTSKDGPAIMQMLVPGYPYDMAEIQDLIFKSGNMPAMRMSEQMLGMMRSHMPKDFMGEACRSRQATRVGEESVTVPAGTFKTSHYRDASSGNDVWISESVPFGMVKSHTGTNGDIVLTASGQNAKSLITETPQEMPSMGLPHN
ncbi:MAG: hypothetical protein ABI613_03685 [Gemmatimonadota bacterium]